MTTKTYWFWVWLVQMTVQKAALKAKCPRGELWRNLVILSASDEKEAVAKALQMGRADQGDSRGSLTLDGKPAVTQFLGIEDMGLIHDGLEDGAEILFRLQRALLSTARRKVKATPQLRASLKKEMAPYRSHDP